MTKRKSYGAQHRNSKLIDETPIDLLAERKVREAARIGSERLLAAMLKMVA